MKTLFVLTSILIVFTSCRNESVSYKTFGKEITPTNGLDINSMTARYGALQFGDTLNSKLMAKVDEVCQAKGCWMKLNLNDGNQVMVRFKDYAFFMPKDIVGKEVIIEGKAFVTEVSIDEQRHYAEDAGKSKEAIDLIKAPKKTYAFEAEGVLLKQ